MVWTDGLARSERTDPRPHFAMNVAHLIRGEFGEAWKTHARALQESGDIESVRGWIDSLLHTHPANPHVQLVTGLFLSQSGESEQSVERYKEAIRLDPRSPYPHYFLAQIHDRAGRLELAYVAARVNLGVAYQEQGRLEMAIPQYREVIALKPNDPLARANLACALAEQGKIEAALMEYKEAIRLNPVDAELHFALGGVYEQKGRPDLAMGEYREALKAEPAFAPAETRIGWILFDKGRKEEAMDAFNRALKLNPEDAQAYFGIGRIYAEREKHELATEHYAQALKLEKDPDRKNAIVTQLYKEGGTMDG
jgi:tetratricopeptide (TPR) repeat protein